MNVERLYGLRLTTPRLELRLPHAAEVEELYEVAAAGIHPPEEMPFGFAWTDNLEHDGFIDYHRHLRESWRPESWKVGLPRRVGRRRYRRRPGARSGRIR